MVSTQIDMLTNNDRHYAEKRKKLWDTFGWVYKGIGYLSQNGSLKCNCSMCRNETYFKRLDNKKDRSRSKVELMKEIEMI